MNFIFCKLKNLKKHVDFGDPLRDASSSQVIPLKVSQWVGVLILVMTISPG